MYMIGSTNKQHSILCIYIKVHDGQHIAGIDKITKVYVIPLRATPMKDKMRQAKADRKTRRSTMKRPKKM